MLILFALLIILPPALAMLAVLAAFCVGLPTIAMGATRTGRVIAIIVGAVGVLALAGTYTLPATKVTVLISALPLAAALILLGYARFAEVPKDEPEGPAPIGDSGVILEYARGGARSRSAISNRAALASVPVALFGCIPYLAGIVAVVLGAIGWYHGRKPGVGGRAMALFGIILGSASVLAWCIPPAWLAWEQSQLAPAEAVAVQFINDVSRGDGASAQGLCAGVGSAQIQSAISEVKRARAVHGGAWVYGPEVLLSPWTEVRIEGAVSGPGSTVDFSLTLERNHGTYRVIAVATRTP